MKKSAIIWSVIGSVVLIFLVGGCSTYNGMVNLDEEVDQSWANVQSSYQRRLDLIPNLVNTVKGYAAHEKSTLEGVTAQRTGTSAAAVDKAAQELLDAKNAVGQFNGPDSQAATPQQYQNLERAYGLYINAVHEAYPDLKANENFLGLQDELAGTENRINVERNRYNETVKKYNVKVRRFPNNIFAGLFGFDTKQPFAADQGAQNAPVVEF
ncbi:MAG: LemA family protein [Muribaculaceae bacterium]